MSTESADRDTETIPEPTDGMGWLRQQIVDRDRQIEELRAAVEDWKRVPKAERSYLRRQIEALTAERDEYFNEMEFRAERIEADSDRLWNAHMQIEAAEQRLVVAEAQVVALTEALRDVIGHLNLSSTDDPEYDALDEAINAARALLASLPTGEQP